MCSENDAERQIKTDSAMRSNGSSAFGAIAMRRKYRSNYELREQIVRAMRRRGRRLTTGEIVDLLGRARGSKEGWPVLKELHLMAQDGIVNEYAPSPGSGYNGYQFDLISQ